MVSVNKMRCFTLISGCRRCNAYAYKSYASLRCFRSFRAATGIRVPAPLTRRFTLMPVVVTKEQPDTHASMRPGCSL